MGTSEPAEIVEIVQNPVIPAKRQYRNVETKRKLVEATLVPGASVARVARTNGVNTNQLFTWRRLYLAGRLGEGQRSTKLLPVTLQLPTSAASPARSARFTSSWRAHRFASRVARTWGYCELC
jgi:transposase-like protein